MYAALRVRARIGIGMASQHCRRLYMSKNISFTSSKVLQQHNHQRLCRPAPHAIILRRDSYHGYVRKPSPFWKKVLGQITVVLGLVLATTLYFACIEEVAVTKRRRFMIFEPQDDEQIGKEALETILKDAKVCEDKRLLDLVKIVGSRISKEVEALGINFKWEFHVVESKQVNAFCLPGGKVVVYTGLLDHLAQAFVCKKIGNFGDALGFVMAHEIGHAVARHGAETLSALPFLWLVSWIFSTSPLLMYFETLGLELPMSRAMEDEADAIGLMLMARACFNPSEAKKVVLLLNNDSVFMQYFSTHPVGSSRAKCCEGHLNEAIALAKEQCVLWCDNEHRCALAKKELAEAAYYAEEHGVVGPLRRWLGLNHEIVQDVELVIRSKLNNKDAESDSSASIHTKEMK